MGGNDRGRRWFKVQPAVLRREAGRQRGGVVTEKTNGNGQGFVSLALGGERRKDYTVLGPKVELVARPPVHCTWFIMPACVN